MRDALSILDKIVSFTNGEVTYENTIEHLNILDADYYFKLIDCMLNQDLAGAMLLYDDIDKKGFEGDMVLNGFAEFIRNLLICKDERVSGLLEVVESFRQRYAETAKRTDAGYLVSALNILNEAEINFRAARNKRLHVELALIKLCYLQQALQLTANGVGVDKKKIVDGTKAVAFRNINPIVKEAISTPVTAAPPAARPTEAKLIIETRQEKPLPVVKEEKEAYKPLASIETPPPASLTPPKPKSKTKLTSLEAIRQQIGNGNGDQKAADRPLTEERLRAAWDKFIAGLKEAKNPAWQSFEVAQLQIKNANIFEAVVSNNINQKFLELERNKTSDFLKKELENSQLQFLIVLIEGVQEEIVIEMPLSTREQYQKIIEQYPLVKELRERLRMELDF
jgi:DNA polymerase-3 subunit gamma/tau